MASATFPTTLAITRRSPTRNIALFYKETKYELLKNMRIPVYAMSTVAFPLMFYVLFGIVLGSGNPVNRNQTAVYMLATMGCFGVMAVSLFGFGVSLAIERGQGWLQVKRASPMPIAAYFFAKLFSAIVFSTVIMVLLLAVGVAFGGVRLPVMTSVRLLAILVGGVDSVQLDGTGDRLLRETEFRSGSGQSDLLADVVLLRIVDSALHAAARIADVRQLPTPIPHEPARSECGRHGHGAGFHLATRRGTAVV